MSNIDGRPSPAAPAGRVPSTQRGAAPGAWMRLPQRASLAALAVVYIADVILVSPLAGPAMTPAFLALWSCLYVIACAAISRTSRVAAVAIVAFVTVIIPMLALVAIAWPLHRSAYAVAASLAAEFTAPGSYALLRVAAPLLAALLVATLPAVRGRSARLAASGGRG